MNIATRNKIAPMAKRMAKGINPTEAEISLLHTPAAEVQDAEFNTLLQTAGTRTTARSRRQLGKELLNQLKFATGARRRDDLPPDNPRPEKVKRELKKSKLLRGLPPLCLTAVLLTSGCVSTQYEQAEVSSLTDSQLCLELVSAERELGFQTDYRSALLAIDTTPRPVVTSSSTTYTGHFDAQYNNANQALYGSFHGSGYTTYQHTDMNAGARFGQGLALIINASNASKLETRRNAVLAEISLRREARENKQRVTE